MELPTLIGYIIGAVTSIASATFYIKYQATKANIDGKDATIETLTRQRDATQDENETLREENAQLKGENRTLQGLATQTPEILKLTESITHLSEGLTTQGKQTTKMLAITVKLLRKLAENKGVDDEVTAA